MPNAAMLACAQSSVANTLTDTCTVQRRAAVPDNQGGRTVTYSTFASDVVCRVAPRSQISGSGERVIGGKVTDTYDAIVTFASDQDIRATDRLIWVPPTPLDSITFEVTGIRPRSGQISLRVEVKELR